MAIKKRAWSYGLGIMIPLALMFFETCKNGSPTGPSTSLLEFAGQITSGSQPFGNVHVYLSRKASKETITAGDGKFSFTGLPAGDYIITPSAPGYAFAPSNYELSRTRKDLVFSAGPATYGTEVGAIALNFSAKDQNNALISLNDFQGKVVLFDFTADWCLPCREKAETAEAFFQKYKDKGFIYILLVTQGSASLWALTYGLTFPVLDDNSQTIYTQYKKNSIPLPHVLDRNGTIRYKQEGWNKSEVEDVINKYL